MVKETKKLACDNRFEGCRCVLSLVLSLPRWLRPFEIPALRVVNSQLEYDFQFFGGFNAFGQYLVAQ